MITIAREVKKRGGRRKSEQDKLLQTLTLTPTLTPTPTATLALALTPTLCLCRTSCCSR